MSIGNAVTPLGLGHHNRASLLNSTPRIDESPRGRHLRGRWRLHNHLQGDFLHDQESSNSIKSRSSDHQQFLALTSTPRHSWLRSRLSRCSVSPILLEDDEEGNKDLEPICCANAHEIGEFFS
ncbi:hypothetical protein QAD02_008754 [Eretmocerus hayati]|uniref:Uncharacterized protein n=1 Tax=Eretmocerus hayati TaxID=131215 RepID=A0ACC2N9S6_9HYME|nr:hypothetical protein QAD02_008754 [Eretmocerus hayati]